MPESRLITDISYGDMLYGLPKLTLHVSRDTRIDVVGHVAVSQPFMF